MHAELARRYLPRNCRVVFIPDYLPSDTTLAQVAVLVRFVFQILRLDSADGLCCDR
jgi:hypothetical protein